jgi:hypothetical protein
LTAGRNQNTSVLATRAYNTVSLKAGECLATQGSDNIDDQANPLDAIPNGFLTIGILFTDGIMVE